MFLRRFPIFLSLSTARPIAGTIIRSIIRPIIAPVARSFSGSVVRPVSGVSFGPAAAASLATERCRKRAARTAGRLPLFLAGAAFALLTAGCTTDCLYESYTNSRGQTACARVCPLEDEQGNEVVDSNGKTVYESPEQGEDVDRINCDPFRTVGTTSTSTSSSSTSSSGAAATPTTTVTVDTSSSS